MGSRLNGPPVMRPLVQPALERILATTTTHVIASFQKSHPQALGVPVPMAIGLLPVVPRSHDIRTDNKILHRPKSELKEKFRKSSLSFGTEFRD